MANEIDVRLDRGEYVGGDTIHGSVYLRIQEQVTSSTLKLVVRGFQTCKYGYKYIEQSGEGSAGEGMAGEGSAGEGSAGEGMAGEGMAGEGSAGEGMAGEGMAGEEGDDFTSRVGQRNMLKDIIKEEIVIAEGLFPVGWYAYPFLYELPHNLPGSFSVQYEDMDSSKSWEGVVQYTMTAILIGPDPAANRRLTCETGLVVYDSIDCRNSEIAPQPQSASGSVRTFFCLTRGSVQVTCKLESSSYCPYSRIILTLDIKNDSSVDVTGFTVNLLRVIKLQALDRLRDEEELSTHTVLSTILDSEGQGCPHNNRITHEVVLNLSVVQNSQSVGVPPNTSASLVKCSYAIDVNVHVPWGPDIELRQPLLIKASDNEAWKRWSPPSWIDKCVKARTIGAASVPEDVLESPTFSGIPHFGPVT